MSQPQSIVQGSAVAYIVQHRTRRKRAEIDQALVVAGFDAAEIDDAWRLLGAEERATLATVVGRVPLPVRNVVAGLLAIVGGLACVLSLSLPFYNLRTGTVDGYGRSAGRDIGYAFHWPALPIAALSVLACALLLWQAPRTFTAVIFFFLYVLIGLELTSVVFTLFTANVPFAYGLAVYFAALTLTLVASVFATT